MVKELGTKADPHRDKIAVDDRPLRAAEHLVYLMLHKPVGFVTTLSDPQGRPTVRDLLRDVRERVFPVGRLDYHSAGLLLLTNDGELAQRLMHPKHGVRKMYQVKVKGVPAPEALRALEGGVDLPEGRTAPAQVRIVGSRNDKTWLELTISEGKRRQIRRMCETVGHPVEKLVRVRLGPLKLGKLRVGSFRELTGDEVLKLQKAVGLR